jgi:hypothetical protein
MASVTLSPTEARNCMQAAAASLHPDRVLAAMNDGILPVNGNPVFLYGVDKAAEVLTRLGQHGGFHHRMMMFEDVRPQKPDADVPPVGVLADCFRQLMHACQDPDKLLGVTLRAVEALEKHPTFRWESCGNQLAYAAQFFNALPYACLLLGLGCFLFPRLGWCVVPVATLPCCMLKWSWSNFSHC